MKIERAIAALKAQREKLLASLGADLLEAALPNGHPLTHIAEETQERLDALDELLDDLEDSPHARAMVEEAARRLER